MKDDGRGDPPRTLTVTLDGRALSAAPGETVLSVARRAGVDIPTLCHDDRLAPTGACRMCLVETSDSRRMVPACRHPVADGLQVQTETPDVQRHRRALLALYLADQPGAPTPGSDLERLARRYGVEPGVPEVSAPRAGRPDDANRFIAFRADRCIVCARCTRYCDAVAGVAAITLANRGAHTTIATAGDAGLLDTTCELCGGCVDTCPAGALVERSAEAIIDAGVPLEVVRSTCNYCGVGCQIDLHVDAAQNAVVRVTSPPPGTTTNDGNLCVKGRFAFGFIDHPDRLTTPLVRGADGALHPTDWDTALGRATELLTGVAARYGPDALGFVSSSRCTNEENYLVQKLARAGFGTNNVHQCAAT